MSDSNRDDEQVNLHNLQAQTRHMNFTIESVNFLQKYLIVLVTHISILAISAMPSLSGSVQPVPLMATALLLLTDRGKRDCCLFSMIKAHPSLQTVNLQMSLS